MGAVVILRMALTSMVSAVAPVPTVTLSPGSIPSTDWTHKTELFWSATAMSTVSTSRPIKIVSPFANSSERATSIWFAFGAGFGCAPLSVVSAPIISAWRGSISVVLLSWRMRAPRVTGPAVMVLLPPEMASKPSASSRSAPLWSSHR